METTARANAAAEMGAATEMGEQYSLGRILGIWALAAVPMGIWAGSSSRRYHLISIRIRWERASPALC